MKICIVGQGYVGISLALAAYNYYEVIGFDIDEKRVTSLNSGSSPLHEIKNQQISQMTSSGKYKATSDPQEISNCKIVVIAVPTPLDELRKPDLSLLVKACEIIGSFISPNSLVINESTSFPGTLRKIIAPSIDPKNKKDIEFAASPERVDPGNTNFNQKNTPRLLSGLTESASQQAKNFYSAFCDEIIIVRTPEIAESAKLFENTFRQVNIALVNELAQIMNALSIPVREVIDAASSKPFGFMKFEPGIGVGGHCIPVDPSYLAYAANQASQNAKFIELANSVNLEMPKYVVKRLIEEFGELNKKKVQIVGVAYKPNVSDTRESPAISMLELLRNQGVDVSWHDPLVGKLGDSTSANLGDADLLIFAVSHEVLLGKMQALVEEKKILDTTGKLQGATIL